MKESDTIDFNQSHPNTIQSLTDDLSALGVSKGMTLIVHSSLSSLGWVCAGGSGYISLEETPRNWDSVMPAHSMDSSEPSEWINPPRRNRGGGGRDPPAFNPDPPTRNGHNSELSEQPGSMKSHPNCSFAAWATEALLENHAQIFVWVCRVPGKSPIGWLCSLLGVDTKKFLFASSRVPDGI
jgi:aminoglycoside 3-N-acetyltransferase